MLGGVAVGNLHHFFAGVADNHFAVIAPGAAGGIAGHRRELVDKLRDAFQHLLRQGVGGGEQPGGGFMPVLGLADQIAGDDMGVGSVVGDHRHF